MNCRARKHRVLAQVTLQLRVVTSQTLDAKTRGRFDLDERSPDGLHNATFGRRNRASVRASLRVAEKGVNPPLELVRDVMLQPLGFVVQRFERVAESFCQETFEKTVTADGFKRKSSPFRRQSHAFIWRVRDER